MGHPDPHGHIPNREQHLLVLAAESLAAKLGDPLSAAGYPVHACESAEAAIGLLSTERFTAVLADSDSLHQARTHRSRSGELAAFAGRVKQIAPEAVVLVITPHPSLEAEIPPESVFAVLKHTDALDGRLLLRKVSQAIAAEAAAHSRPTEAAASRWLLGDSPAIRSVRQQIRMVAGRDTTVLITGETGTGKERVAQAIHGLSKRASRPMVSVNCGGIPATLLEDEFFGHVKGAFTDARQARAGRFEQANRSSIFLDEIGDLPLELQPKLLRALQEREIFRIGGVETVRLDVRVIAATNADLWQRVEERKYREDLFYRINVYPIHMPALRERPADVPIFAAHFLDRFCRRDGLPAKHLEPDCERRLMTRRWRGNIRELENAIEIAVIRSGTRREVREEDFLPERQPGGLKPAAPPETISDGDFRAQVLAFEKALIARTLDGAGGNKQRAARMLGLKRTTLIEKLKRFDGPPD